MDIESVLLKIKNRKPVALAVPILAGLVAGFVIVVKPALHRLDVIKAEEVGLTQKASAYQFVLDSETKDSEHKKRFAGDKTWLIEQMTAIAQKMDFVILTTLPEDPKRITDYLDRASVRIEAEGSYHQLGEFVSQVENLGPHVKILTLDINSEGVISSRTQNTATGPGPIPSPQAGPIKPRSAVPANIYNITMSVAIFTPSGNLS